MKKLRTALVKAMVVFTSLALLNGCTAVVEKRILNSAPVVTGLGDLDAYYSANRFEFCSPSVSSMNSEEPRECLTYYDLADFRVEHEGELINLSGQNFTFTNIRANSGSNERDQGKSEQINHEQSDNEEAQSSKSKATFSLSERIEFEFPELPENAPIAVISPGYGLQATQTISPWAAWFRYMGIHPIVLPGPTEYRPMQFGLNHGAIVAEFLKMEHADRPIILLGFSMGVLSATEIEKELIEANINPAALMLVAPMNNFRDHAAGIFARVKERDWRVRWLVSHDRFSTALERVIAASEIDEQELDLYQRILGASTPMVIAASKVDDIVDYEKLRAGFHLKEEEKIHVSPYPEHPEFSVAIEPFTDTEAQLITVPRLNHMGMYLLLRGLRTPLQEWLSSRVELTFAPEPEYPKYSEGEAEALQ